MTIFRFILLHISFTMVVNTFFQSFELNFLRLVDHSCFLSEFLRELVPVNKMSNVSISSAWCPFWLVVARVDFSTFRCKCYLLRSNLKWIFMWEGMWRPQPSFCSMVLIHITVATALWGTLPQFKLQFQVKNTSLQILLWLKSNILND